MWNLIVKKQIPPVRTARYCCEVLKERGGEGCFTAVSYTHLDVYKRQMKNCSNEELRKLIQDYLNEKISWITISGEACGEETGGSKKIDGWDGHLDNGTEECENHVPEPASPKEDEEKLEELRRGLIFLTGTGEQGVNANSSTKEEAKADAWDMTEKLSDILNEAAREQYSSCLLYTSRCV